MRLLHGPRQRHAGGRVRVQERGGRPDRRDRREGRRGQRCAGGKRGAGREAGAVNCLHGLKELLTWILNYLKKEADYC